MHWQALLVVKVGIEVGNQDVGAIVAVAAADGLVLSLPVMPGKARRMRKRCRLVSDYQQRRGADGGGPSGFRSIERWTLMR